THAVTLTSTTYIDPNITREEIPTPNCPKCGELMVLRQKREKLSARNSFWGCSSFPVCRGTRNVS
ncbi:topoisomerase DNA-binding C4 zinc finger domain-containing protein, partial [Vibrio breoganii]